MPLLSKTAFLAGNQCPLRLWFELNDPVPEDRGADVKNRLRWGQRVGELARTHFPSGQRVNLIGGNAVDVTRDLIANGVNVLFEAAFESGRGFAAIDVLTREQAGFRAIEVKMKSGNRPPEDELLDEIAFEYMVMRAAGLDVTRVELMRLNPANVFPNIGDLFVSTNVTADCIDRVDSVRATVTHLLPVIDGARPGTQPGPQCKKPDVCPFFDRCNPPLPADDIRRLYRLHWQRRDKLLAQGVTSIGALPAGFPLTPIQTRQVEALRGGKRVVDANLGPALAAVAFPIAFLDFETANLPMPRFVGMSPWQFVPVQFSCHVLQADGTVAHHQWIAPGNTDPRPEFARLVLDAVRGAGTVAAHHKVFESERLKETATALPALANQLNALADSLEDTEVWINKHVYDLAFDSSFSLKKILPALLGKGYEDLAVQGGLVASALLEQLLWEPEWLEQPADDLRRDLLAYCGRDTEALVSLWHELNRMAKKKPS